MISFIPVISSNLSAVAYDAGNHNLYIRFHSGTYVYYDVPEFIYQGLMNAPSHGKYHAAYIKNNYRYARIS